MVSGPHSSHTYRQCPLAARPRWRRERAGPRAVPGPQEMSPPVSWLMGACPLGEAGGEAPRDTSSHPRPWALCLLDHPWFLWPQQSSQWPVCPWSGADGGKAWAISKLGKARSGAAPHTLCPVSSPSSPRERAPASLVPMGSLLSEGAPPSAAECPAPNFGQGASPQAQLPSEWAGCDRGPWRLVQSGV